MLIRAKKSFAGSLTMHEGEVRECSNEAVLSDLLTCGYVEEVTAKESGEKNESKRSNRKKSS